MPTSRRPRAKSPRAPSDAERVHAFADAFRRDAEGRGRGSEYPSIAQTADALGLRRAAVESAIDDGRDRGLPIDVVVAFRTGLGIRAIANSLDYLIETWPERRDGG